MGEVRDFDGLDEAPPYYGKKVNMSLSMKRFPLSVGKLTSLIFLWGILTGCSETKPSNTIIVPQANPTDDPNEPELEKQARKHAYWNQPLNAERFRWLIGEIQNTRAGRTFIFDRNGYQNAYMNTADIRTPQDVSQSGIPQPAWVSVRGQWSREQAVKELIKSLDEAVKRRGS